MFGAKATGNHQKLLDNHLKSFSPSRERPIPIKSSLARSSPKLPLCLCRHPPIRTPSGAILIPAGLSLSKIPIDFQISVARPLANLQQE
jgi:hypothetical protein